MYKALCAQQPPVLNNSQLLAIARGESEVGIYKRKQVRKKIRKHDLAEESNQEYDIFLGCYRFVLE